VMHPDRTAVVPRRPSTKRCAACDTTKPTGDFDASRRRLSSYCKSCQRQVSRDAYRRRRQDTAALERMRQLDRAASAPSAPAWHRSTPIGSAAPARPARPPCAG
jgi:hypothetical protein